MSHSRTQHTCNSRSPSSSCKAKRLLLRDIRPTPNPQTQSLLRRVDLCPNRCIYCDIWKLALLVSSRQNTHSSSGISTPTSPRFPKSPPPPPPPTSTPSIHARSDYERSLKAIESAHTFQRARVNSIISICTVEGAEESEGLRVAHDRCLGAVLELVRQERALLRWAAQSEREEQARERERERGLPWKWEWEWEREREMDCGHGSRMVSHGESGRVGRGSVVTCAM